MTGSRPVDRAGRRRVLLVALHVAVPVALIVWLMVAAGESPPLPQWAVGEDSGWRQQEQGLDLRTVKLLWPGRPEIDQKKAEVNLTAVRLDTLRFSLEAAFNPIEKSQNLLEIVRAAKSPAAVNGGYFGHKREPVTLLVSGGKELAKASEKLPWSGVYTLERSGRASVRAYAAMKGLPEGCDFAVQNSPMLVAGGQLVWPPAKPPGKEDKKDKPPLRHRRTAAGVDYQGRTVLAVSDSLVTLEEWALLLRAAEKIGGLGLRDAVNLDGGPSSGLAADTGDKATHVPTGVTVPYVLLARRRPEALPALQTPPSSGKPPAEKPPGEFITPK